MKNRLKSIVLSTILVLSLGQTVYAANEFDPVFFNLNDIIYYDATEDECLPAPSSSSGANLTGNDNAEKIWNFLKGKGLTDNQVAGIMGALWGESNGFVADANEIGSGIGYGIAQWSFGRRTNLENFAKQKGIPVSDLGLQLEFLWTEVEGPYNDVYQQIKSQDSLEHAAKWWIGDWGWGFERPEGSLVAGRNAEAKQIGQDLLAKFGGRGGSSSSSSSTSSSSSETPSDGSSSTSSESSSGKYSFIGDSITASVQDKLSSSFNGSSVDAVVGRGITQPGQGGGSVMDYLNSNLTLENSVVINIGANDQFPESSAKQMLDKIGKDKKVYLVNNYSKNVNTNFEVTNTNIQKVAQGYSNVTVLDWKSYVDQNGGKEKNYDSDGVHLSEEGKDLYIKFLQSSLSGDNNSNNSSLNACANHESRSGGGFFSSEDASHITSDGFPVYEQCDPRWADAPGNGGTMCQTACGPTSIATAVLALTGKAVNPVEIARKAEEKGYGTGYGTNLSVINLANDYGLKTKTLPNTIQAVEETLKSGGLVLVAGEGDGPFLGISHYTLIRKSEGGKWYTANPGRKELDETPYDPSYVMSMVFFTGAITK